MLALALLVAGCGPKTPPAVAPVPPATAVGVRQLPSELDTIFGGPSFERALVAIVVQSLDSGEYLYRRNPAKLVMPASNMKIPTVAAAAERLGWDYTYETRLLTTGVIDGTVLRGDLIVSGSGDPTLNRRNGDPMTVLAGWAATLREAGIQRIEGRILGHDARFANEPLGAGWSWDYLVYGYAAPVSGLQLNENVVQVLVRPGVNLGDPVVVTLRPDESGLTVENHATTGATDNPPRLRIGRLPGSNVIRLSGTLPLGAAETTLTATVDNPIDFFARVLKGALVASGVAVSGEAVDGRLLSPPVDVSSARVLLSHKSPPLREIAKVLLKVSQNLYAETLLRTVGASAAAAGSAATGVEAAREVLEGWGIPPDSVVMVDGSGLSRYNYLTADTLVAILRQMHRDPRHRAAFADALPIAGVDGSISRRMRGTRAEGNARAKTGSISNVRALSGYVQTMDAETLAFSIVVNNFTVPQATVDAAIDLAVERLANMTRRPANR